MEFIISFFAHVLPLNTARSYAYGNPMLGASFRDTFSSHRLSVHMCITGDRNIHVWKNIALQSVERLKILILCCMFCLIYSCLGVPLIPFER